MKKIYLAFAMILASITFSPPSQAALSVDAMVEKIVATIQGEREATVVCEKGILSKKQFTLRSFDGNLCRFAPVAKIARVLCDGYVGEDGKSFEKSQCYLNMNDETKKISSMSDLVKAIKSDLPTSAKKFLCSPKVIGAIKKKAGPVADTLDSQCG